MERDLDLTLVMNRALDVFKQKWLKLSGLVLLMYVAMIVPLWIVSATVALPGMDEEYLDALNSGQTFGSHGGVILLAILIGGVLSVYVTMLLYKTILSVAKGKTIPLELSTVVNYFAVTIIVVIIAVVAACMCYIPFFIIYPRVMFAPIYFIDNPKLGVGGAIEQSWNATKGNVVKLLLLGVIAYVITSIGSMLLWIGLVPAFAFTNAMLVVVYLILSGQDELAQDDVAPKEETFVVEEKTVCRD